MFTIYVTERKIKIERSDTLVSGSINSYPVQFFFQQEWEHLEKKAVFMTKNITVEVPLDGKTPSVCQIPNEILLIPNLEVKLAVYGNRKKKIEPDDTFPDDSNYDNDTDIDTVLEEDREDVESPPETGPDYDEDYQEEEIDFLLSTTWVSLGTIRQGAKN